MKILYIITQGGLWGGAQRYVCDAATGAREQFEVFVAVGEPDGKRDLQERLLSESGSRNRKSPGVLSVIQLRHLRRRISPMHDLLAVLELRKLYRELQPDIVHLNSSKAGVVGAISAIGMPVKVVYTAHGWVFTEPGGFFKKTVYLFLEWLAARFRDRTIALSQSDREIAEKKLHIRASTIHYIPLGIDSAPFLPKTRSETCRIFCVANFFPAKGVNVLIQAFIRAFTDETPARLTLIGDGPERERLTEMVRAARKEDKIIFAGFVPDAGRAMADADLVVLPSLKEGLPYALLEARRARVPIIATSVGDIPNHIKNLETGLLVPPGDAQKLADALAYAYAHPEDMRRMADVAPLPPTRETMINGTISLYREMFRREEESHS